MKSIMKSSVLIILLSLLMFQFGLAANYYVDAANGNDSNSGTSENSAWKSISKINSSTFLPGDQILFKRGGTWKETLNFPSNGTKANPIVLDSYGTGELPLFDGELTRDNCIMINGNEYITIKNLQFTNAIGEGAIRIKYGTGVVVEACTFYVTGHGGVMIENSTDCVISHNKMTTPTTEWNYQTDGIYSQRNNSNTYDGNNIVISNQHPDQHCDGIQTFQDGDIVLKNNYIEQVNHKTGNAQGIYSTTAAGHHIYFNNVVKTPNTLANTIAFRNYETGTGNVEIYNNTVITGGGNAIHISEDPGAVIKNNILISNGTSYCVKNRICIN